MPEFRCPVAMCASVGKSWPWYLAALAVVVLDQLTKYAALAYLDYGQPVVVTGFFNLTLLYNPGAAFSFLGDAGGWQRWFLILVSLVISAVITVWMARLPAGAGRQKLALALILGGAIGNLWDRVALGHVVDFIQLHYHGFYWPAFNIADAGITLGAVAMILDTLRSGPDGSGKDGPGKDTDNGDKHSQ